MHEQFWSGITQKEQLGLKSNPRVASYDSYMDSTTKPQRNGTRVLPLLIVFLQGKHLSSDRKRSRHF